MPFASKVTTARRRTMKQAIGAFGETFAAHELQRRGYDIIERNVRFPDGEIDIVAGEGGETVFVEVKTRRASVMSLPEEAVDDERMGHLEAAIVAYCETRAIVGQPYRIEVVAIDVDRSGRVTRCEVMGDVGLR